jgi:MFS transporter, FHS family, glucose/mannose:H+ symporter
MPESSPHAAYQRNATLAANAAFIPTGVVTVLLGPLLPTLSARWALTDSQAGELFTAQFAASTVGVFLSGALVPRIGYRFAIVLGVFLMAVGVGLLPLTTWPLGLATVACWGVGLGVTIPACNLIVAEVHPDRSAAALNILNFSWSVGAVACPFLLAPFERRGIAMLYPTLLAGVLVLIAIGLAALPLPAMRKPAPDSPETRRSLFAVLATPLALIFAALFFLYTGVENSVGGWLASYAKRMASGEGTLWVTAPSFFYFALMLGRVLAHPVLRRVRELRLARLGLILSVAGIVALLAANSTGGILASASVAGFGLATVYPITIAMMTRTVGRSSAAVSSVMFALAGLGAACVPWLVGFESTAQTSLKMGLGVALAACVAMLLLYLRRWPETVSMATVESAPPASDLVH